MKKLTKLFILGLALVLVLGLAACNGTQKLAVTADKTTAAPGDVVTFTATLDGEATKDAVYSITEGAQIAALDGNRLTVGAAAKTGDKIKVTATLGELTANVVDIAVVVPVTGITASANGIANVMPGGSVILNKTVAPDGAADEAKWVVAEGGEYAAVSGDVLVISANAPIGTLVKVYAKMGDIDSNTLVFTVGVPVTGIEISAIGSTTVVKGNTVSMTEIVTPDNASAAAISYVIVEGADYATITSKTLVVKSTAPTDAVIKVKAVIGTVESNVLTFTVAATQAEINGTRYLMSFDQDRITLDKNGAFLPMLSLDVYNYNFESVTGLDIDYEILSGEEFLAIAPNGYTCALTALGHGTATVKATIRGTDVSQTATVSVIVPPEALVLPEVFAQRPGFLYSFSRLDPKTSAAESLPFAVSLRGEGACEALKYTFTHKDGTSGDAVATYADGKITFFKSGEVTVTVTSASGSAVEASVSYRFNINEGYNVESFDELRLLADDPAYMGNLPINVVVLTRPDGSANGYEYGFDLVPPVALKAKAEQTFAEIATQANRIAFVNKGLLLNGNMHKIDASQLRIPTADELRAATAAGNGWGSHSSLLGVYPWTETAQNALNTYRVSMYDFEVVGNCPITLDANAEDPAGVYRIGILVGSYDESYRANYYLTMENVNASACDVGMRLLHVLDGRVKNTFLNNCYSNGLEVGGSIITLENMIYGACGATGIEVVAKHCTMAGVNWDKNQQVTYAGTVSAQFYNDTHTEYLENYEVISGTGITVPVILNASIGHLTDNQMAHLNGGNGFVFVTFMFHDLDSMSPNTSEIIYPGFQTGGFIAAEQLPAESGKDTTHEYIAVQIVFQGIHAGVAYFHNVNYQAN